MKKTIGNFEIIAFDPYPIWITIKHGDKEIQISHKDIPDLEHCIKSLKFHCKEELSKDYYEKDLTT